MNFVALGDRHSATKIGKTNRIWYSGSHLATDFGEERSGLVLLVDLSAECNVQERQISSWKFLEQIFQINDDSDIDTVESYLSATEQKDKTVLRLGLKGTASIAGKAKLDVILSHHRDMFAMIEEWERESDLVVSFDIENVASLGLRGFADETLKKLVDGSKGTGDEAKKARDALALLYRLARSG